MAIKDLAGQTFGEWTVVTRAGKTRFGVSTWLCRCSCGAEKVVNGNNLGTGQSKSCGCLNRKALLAALTKHGKKGTREYAIWCGMKSRCYNPNRKKYKDYGARGITVAAEWMDFGTFYGDMGACPSVNHSIERIDNNKGYSKDNCVWATAEVQSYNKRTTRTVIYNGKPHTMKELSDKSGISTKLLHDRLRKGWSVERAANQPVLRGL